MGEREREREKDGEGRRRGVPELDCQVVGMPLSAEAGARTPATAERTNVTTAAVLIVSFWAAGTLSNLVLGGLGATT